ncbi:MAG TPA: hypothetical protein VFL29_13040 [Candidatus Dormibacteraeota bacterium]|nr:hypothetical protein [Candidatus Dormibacteraeota bacterium]
MQRQLASAGVLVVTLFALGACGQCGAVTSPASGDSCAHPGLCLTVTGPLAGSTSGLVLAPDCIPGGGLDAAFTTTLGGRETSIEILVTDDAVKSSPGFHAGTFAIKSRGQIVKGTAYASVWVKPDKDVTGFAGGWSTDSSGSAGTVTIDAGENGTVSGVIAPPAAGEGASLHINGKFHCR